MSVVVVNYFDEAVDAQIILTVRLEPGQSIRDVVAAALRLGSDRPATSDELYRSQLASLCEALGIGEEEAAS